MNHIYSSPTSNYPSSPMSYSRVPDLISSYDDISTAEPSPSPPIAFASLGSPYQRPISHATTYADYPQRQDLSQPMIVNSIEFHDLTKLHAEDSHRRRRRSTTAQEKEAATNMRIRRRAQNRASQRAFRERKEKHVQHLEHELEKMEEKHRDLSKSYNQVEGSYAKLQREVGELKEELSRWRSSSGTGSTEGSLHGTPTQTNMKIEIESGHYGSDLFDPFAAEEFFGCSSGGQQGSF